MEPQGAKGFDYDIRLVEFGVNIEVKHKVEGTEPTKRTLERTLGNAKSQVPHSEPAIIFIKIPQSWARHPSVLEIVNRSLGSFFKRSNNIMGVIFHWSENLTGHEGAFLTMAKYEKNENCTYNFPELNEKINESSSLQLDTFTGLILKYIGKCPGYPDLA